MWVDIPCLLIIVPIGFVYALQLNAQSLVAHFREDFGS